MIAFVRDDGGRADAGFRGKTGDCVVRAIAIASGRPYRDVYRAMADAMGSHGYVRTGNAFLLRRPKGGRKRVRPAVKIQRDVIETFGFVKVKLPPGPRPTYTEAFDRWGSCIVSTRRHVCAIVDGALRDTFDGRTYDWEGDFGFIETRERKAMSVWVPRLDHYEVPA